MKYAYLDVKANLLMFCFFLLSERQKQERSHSDTEHPAEHRRTQSVDPRRNNNNNEQRRSNEPVPSLAKYQPKDQVWSNSPFPHCY